MPCWKEPFFTFLNGTERLPIEQFIDILPDVFNGSQGRSFRTKNYQSFEMGLDHLNDDDEYIQTQLKRVDEQFDLGTWFKMISQ